MNGQLHEVDKFAYGISTPVSSIDDFQSLLFEWNKLSSNGKFSPVQNTESIEVKKPDRHFLLSETPIQAIWLRLKQLESLKLAQQQVSEKAENAEVNLEEEVVQTKAEGIAFALRNAADYFQAREGRTISQRVLNLYYGTLSFAFAELLSSPTGPSTLAEIESQTKMGHGLYTIDGQKDGIENIVVGVISRGFFPFYTKLNGYTISDIPEKKPRKWNELSKVSESTWTTIEQLFSRIPEVSDLFLGIFESPPSWAMPNFDQNANTRISVRGSSKRPSSSYIQFSDESCRLTSELIAEIPGPISEIIEVPGDSPGRHFRARVDHPNNGYWHEVLKIHHSPFTHRAMIIPLFGSLIDLKEICLVLLYALSIVVRYRPSIWRRVQEGDLDHMRVIIEAFLQVVERILPEKFLVEITGKKIAVHQPGGLF